MITLIANAKINLFLDIINRRPDGYHNLNTVMQSVDLSDILTIELSDKITVECSDPSVPQNEGNICYNAADSFYALLGKQGGAEIKIEKRIPHDAGLGGGSADAAALLRGLNALCGNPIEESELIKLGAKIGADVPFCMTGGQQSCKGIGDTDMKYITDFDYEDFLIVKPPFSCGTAQAYAEYDKAPLPRFNRCPKDAYEVYNIFRELYNNEEINEIIEKLKALGAEAAELTGSGSAVFGAFKSREYALKAARNFGDCFTAVCKAASRGIIIVDK